MIPLMPQGVEHLYGQAQAAGLIGVMIPLMPQGVEHCGVLSEWGEISLQRHLYLT